MDQKFLIIKYPVGIVSELMLGRAKIVRYTTNKLLRTYGSYCILKAHTSSGIVKEYQTQTKLIQSLLKCTRNTVKSIIKELIQKKLAIIVGNDLILMSWKKSNEIFGINSKPEYIEVKFDLTNQDLTPQYLFYTTEILINQDKQTQAIAKRVNATHGLRSEIDEAIICTLSVTKEYLSGLTWPEYLKLWLTAQIKAFENGATALQTLHLLRPNVNRKLSNITMSWGMKDGRTASYVKRKLLQLGLINLTKVGAIYAKNQSIRAYKLCESYCDGFCKNTKLPIWWVSDQIEIKLQTV